VRCSEGLPRLNVTRQVSATTFAGLVKEVKDLAKGVRIFAASIADINKALALKRTVDVKSLLPKQY
jgi:hypothetical protein